MIFMAKKLNVKNLEGILRKTGLYDRIPINSNPTKVDFNKLTDKIVGDKDGE